MTSFPAELLRHHDFVRSLARGLLRGDDADDAAQQSWVQALRAAPDDPARARGWLARVVTNVAHNARRSALRREQRERVAAVAEAAGPTPDQVLAAEQLRQEVVAAVLELPEPYRQTVLMRFYEDLAPAEIARRLGVPASTARTRLKRGLDALRARLEAARGREWPLAVAPLARGATTAALLPTSLLLGKATLAGAAAVLAVAATWLLLRGGGAPGALPEPGPMTPVPAPLAVADRIEADAPTPSRTEREAQPAADAPPTFPADRAHTELRVLVVDGVGTPVAGASVRATPFLGVLPAGARVADDRSGEVAAHSDADGRAVLRGIAEGPWRLRARAEAGSAHRLVIASARAPADAVEIVELAEPTPPPTWRVRVVDADRRPVGGAEVRAWSGLAPPTDGRLLGSTGDDGWLVVEGTDDDKGILIARVDDGRCGSASLGGNTTPTITVEAAAAVRGRITGVDAALLAGATVSLHLRDNLHPYYTAIGRRVDVPVADGVFAADGLPPGRYGVTLASDRDVRLQSPAFTWGEQELPNSVRMIELQLAAGTVAEPVLAASRGGRIEGRVTADDGRPVAGARVHAVLAPRTSNFPDGFVLRGAPVWRFDSAWQRHPGNPPAHRWTETDGDGRYAFPGAHPGAYRVEVFRDRLSYDRQMPVEVNDGEIARLTHRLSPAGVLQVAADPSTSYVGVLPVHGDAAVMLAIVPSGVATFPGLAAGRYRVASFHSDARIAPTVLGEAEVHAGRTTWLDLRAAGIECVVTGTVRAGGEPVADALVRWHPYLARTAADGSFQVRLTYRPRRWAFGPEAKVVVGGITHMFKLPGSESEASRVALDLHLGEAELRVRTIDGDGASAAAEVDVSGQAVPAVDGRPASVQGRVHTAADGVAVVPHLPPGNYAVYARFAGGAEVVQRIELTDRGAVVELREPACGTLEVTAIEDRLPAAGRRLALGIWRGEGPAPADEDAFQQRMEIRKATCDVDGRATFAAVPVGPVLVLPSAPFLGTVRAVGRATVERGATTRVQVEIAPR